MLFVFTHKLPIPNGVWLGMSRRKGILNLTWVHCSLLIPLALYLWFAWEGFSKMTEDQSLSWRWYADLIGGLSSLIMVGLAIYVLVIYNKKILKLPSRK